MSLTTVASPVQPDDSLLHLAPSRPERFQRSDFIAAGLVFLITLGVYVATLAPNVTLEDSGELITAAAKFGVGHPPGYPLWTLSGFLLSHLFPFGNLAWRINLQSALFGAESNAVLTLLVCHSGRWLLQRWTDEKTQAAVRPFCFYAGMFSGLTIGFSNVMWSQAVISAVHGTIQALILNLVLLLFYLWMLEPHKGRRLVLTVLVFAFGLTNHHTLVQIIPAFLLAAILVRAGKFWSVFLAVNLFSLSILVYITWLSGNRPLHQPDEQLQRISEVMARLIFPLTAVISFFYLKQFRLHLFLLGAATACAIFAYGHYLMGPSDTQVERWSNSGSIWQWGSLVHPGWLQITTLEGLLTLALAALALGLLYTSTLDRRLIIGIFVAGWVGLLPYAYEPFASSTNPPMNWGFASERSGFYYEVSREQYPKSLPNLIKTTFGKVIGVVPKDAQLDATIGLPDYFPRLGKTFYYYGYEIQQNFTVPLIFLTLSVLLYVRRCDRPQINWFIFLGVALFLLGFMLQLIAPQEAFDFQHNLQYKVFHLQSHCIFVILMGYGALAAMTYLHEAMAESVPQHRIVVFGVPAIFLSLLPLWSNVDSCNQAEHWFGYDFGADMMRDMDKNAVYFGGSDAGRFVPTYMAFVESQQDDRWKREPGFDRRDVTVITQNALCDTYYTQYIRNQYDDRFRPKPDQYSPFEKWLGRDRAYPQEQVTCMSDDELLAAWEAYDNSPEVLARVKAGGIGQRLRPGTTDVFDINGIVAQKMFEKNKKDHTFYIEQSVPITWMYPYLRPWGLILKLNPTPMDAIPPEDIAKDRKFWTDYANKLLSNPRFRIDDMAVLNFGKLAFWHSDLYRYRGLLDDEEYWLKISLALCPQLPDAVNVMTHLLVQERRYDEALTVAQNAVEADPSNDAFPIAITAINAAKLFGQREVELRGQLAKAPYDVGLNLELARLLQDEGKFNELDDRLRIAAGLTNWSHDDISGVIQYYVDKVHNPDAAIAFLEVRASIDPKASELVYNLAALNATLNRQDEAVKYLTQAAQYGGTNALISAGIDPRFTSLHDDVRFQALMNSTPKTAPATNTPKKNPPAAIAPVPVKN
jgi:tetratricopeptide (TPR) repeat protein